MAETKKDALAAFDAFVETICVECLIKDRDALLAFYDFPAEHWKHLRTTNVIESSFATVRHRTMRSKGYLSKNTALAMSLQARRGRREKLASSRWSQPVAESHPRCKSSPTESRSSDRKLKPLPPDPFRHQEFGDSSGSAANPVNRRARLAGRLGNLRRAKSVALIRQPAGAGAQRSEGQKQYSIEWRRSSSPIRASHARTQTDPMLAWSTRAGRGGAQGLMFL